MIKFPSIEQYRHLIHQVKAHYRYVGTDEAGEPIYDHNRTLPTLTFRGTTKLHGTNAAIQYDCGSDLISFQSRSRVLSSGDDNAGFYAAMALRKDEDVAELITTIHSILSKAAKSITIFGEWCGKGIQKGVAVSELPKMFVYFATRVEYEDGASEWLDVDLVYYCNHVDIFNILDFYNMTVEIDFNCPAMSQNQLIELTEAIEAECPVGKAFGVSGVGEGIVWTCITPGWESSKFWMKVKGEKHSVSKVKTLAAVDVEALASIQAFLDYAVTEARLEQAFVEVNAKDIKDIVAFLRWVYNDIVKEEADTIEANNLDPLGKHISSRARPWFIKRINNA
jgi:hypothetical protein